MLGNPNVFGSPGVAGAKIAPHAWRTLYKSKIGFAWRWDHPRIRGEHLYDPKWDLCPSRIIPAYAGNTRQFKNACRFNGGSSPHTRGTRSPRLSAAERCWDHPRIRGEHPSRASDAASMAGIIHAYAGNTHFAELVHADGEGSSPHTRGTRWRNDEAKAMPVDHPRIRGEHRRVLGRHVRLAGIIPAYAGNTIVEGRAKRGFPGSSPHTRGTPGLAAPSSTCGGDHPRIRGEHALHINRA